MARTKVATSSQRPASPVAVPFRWPEGAEPGVATIKTPRDARQEAGFVVARVSEPRRPPSLALNLPKKALAAAFGLADKDIKSERAHDVDLGSIPELPPELLAWQVIELSARLQARQDLAKHAKAKPGLDVLLYQARLFQHLQILQSSAAEGVA